MAFAALGPDFAGAGVLAALLAAVIAPLVQALLGLHSPQIFVARGVSAVVLAGFLGDIAQSHAGRITPLLIAEVILLFGLLIAIFEMFFSVARVGRLAKYLPAPVMTGFQWGVALVMLVAQGHDLLGIGLASGGRPWHTTFDEIRPLALLVSAATMVLIVALARRTPRLPTFLCAIAGGTLLHWVLILAGFGAYLGETIGTVSTTLPHGAALGKLLSLDGVLALWPLFPTITGWALTAAIMSTTESLIGHKFVEDLTDQRIDSDRELLRSGAANAVSALASAFHAGANLASTVQNVQQGGRSSRSSVAAALLILLFALGLAPLFGLIPRAAIAAMLVMVAVRMFDRWTVQTGLRVARGQLPADRDLLGMLGTVAIVAGVALLVNFIVAVAIGLLIAIGAFLWRMSRSIVRRAGSGQGWRSRVLRNPTARAQLERLGATILVFELEGPLFFGTGEKLQAAVEQRLQPGTRYVVLDLQRINDIDSTGARLLYRLGQRLTRQGRTLMITGLQPRSRLAQILDSFDQSASTAGTHSSLRRFADLDHGLEWAEDQLLSEAGHAIGTAAALEPQQTALCADFTADELTRFMPYLSPVHFAAGDIVFRVGDPGNALYAVLAGRASVILEHGQSATRLASFEAGAFFGEMAVLDHQRRSATVRADSTLLCARLSQSDFERLQYEQPDCAIKLLTNLGRELAARLRGNNATIQALSN